MHSVFLHVQNEKGQHLFSFIGLSRFWLCLSEFWVSFVQVKNWSIDLHRRTHIKSDDRCSKIRSNELTKENNKYYIRTKRYMHRMENSVFNKLSNRWSRRSFYSPAPCFCRSFIRFSFHSFHLPLVVKSRIRTFVAFILLRVYT